MPDAKLSANQKQDLLRRYASGEPVTPMAKEYGISEAYARRLCTKNINSFRVTSENKEQSYRENLNWALSAVGEFLRTNRRPETCPNNAAWFLYQQACTEPKDFMAKVAQVEKGDDGEAERLTRKSAQRSIAEIDEMLAGLEVSDG